MIIEIIFGAIFSLLMAIISLFPAFPSLDFEYLNDVVQFLSVIDTFVSLRVFTSCMVVVLVVYNARLIWSIVMWVIRKLPGVQ